MNELSLWPSNLSCGLAFCPMQEIVALVIGDEVEAIA